MQLQVATTPFFNAKMRIKSREKEGRVIDTSTMCMHILSVLCNQHKSQRLLD